MKREEEKQQTTITTTSKLSTITITRDQKKTFSPFPFLLSLSWRCGFLRQGRSQGAWERRRPVAGRIVWCLWLQTSMEGSETRDGLFVDTLETVAADGIKRRPNGQSLAPLVKEEGVCKIDQPFRPCDQNRAKRQSNWRKGGGGGRKTHLMEGGV